MPAASHNLIVDAGSADSASDDFARHAAAHGHRPAGDRGDGPGCVHHHRRLFARRGRFWVENGEIAYPVEEITIAANLRDMFAGIVAVGADVDPRSHILSGRSCWIG